MRLLPQPNLIRFDRSVQPAKLSNTKKILVRGGCPARSKALGSGPSLVGVRGFESLPPHNLIIFAKITGYNPENAMQTWDI